LATNSDAARFVGSIPEHYDRGLGPMIFVDFADDIARRVAACNPKRVLETAAGTGIVTRRLRDLLPAHVGLTATDLNPPMLEIARTKFREGENVAFVPADATALPFADASFDAAVCQFGVMFFPDKRTSYQEVHRVLAPGGTYVFNVWDAHEHNPFGRIAHEVVGRFFPADQPQFLRVPFSYHHVEPIVDDLTAAGFTRVESTVRALVKEIPDASAFARGLIYGSPLIDQIRERGVEPKDVVSVLSAELQREFGSDPGRMPLQAIVVWAKKST
jgi:ubiquinone/menaquinone biosynthesis C-methylase UbiE